jgi:hypothetical protein
MYIADFFGEFAEEEFYRKCTKAYFQPIFCQITKGLYSETGFHIGMDQNFVCLWRRHKCKSQVIDLSLSALIS